MSDAYDIEKVGSPFVNKQLLSKDFKFNNNSSFKNEELLFLVKLMEEHIKTEEVFLRKLKIILMFL